MALNTDHFAQRWPEPTLPNFSGSKTVRHACTAVAATIKPDSPAAGSLPPKAAATFAHFALPELDCPASLRKSGADDTRRRTGIRRAALSTDTPCTAGILSGKTIGGGRCVARSRLWCFSL